MYSNNLFGQWRSFFSKKVKETPPTVSKPKKERQKINITSNALPYHLVNRRCLKTIKNQEEHPTKRKSAFMLLVMANTGLRYSDAKHLKHRDIINIEYRFKAQKTGINNEVRFNQKVQTAYKELIKGEKLKIGYQTKQIFTTTGDKLIYNKQINDLAKYLFADYVSKGYNVSSYSMRKTFSAQLIECSPNQMIGFLNLQEAFGHKDANNTFSYLDKRALFPKTISRKLIFELRNRNKKRR